MTEFRLGFCSRIILRDLFVTDPAHVFEVREGRIHLREFDQFGRSEEIWFNEARSSHFVPLGTYETNRLFGYIGSGMSKARLEDLARKMAMRNNENPVLHNSFLEEKFDVHQVTDILTEPETQILEKYGHQVMAIVLKKTLPRSAEELKLVEIQDCFFPKAANSSGMGMNWRKILFPGFNPTIQKTMRGGECDSSLISLWIKILMEMLWDECVRGDKAGIIRWDPVRYNYMRLAVLGHAKAMEWADRNFAEWRDPAKLAEWVKSLEFESGPNVFGDYFDYGEAVRG